jgi:hypothetical protein
MQVSERRTGKPMNSDLQKDIKFNCDVSDAQYWGFFSVCGLLLRYRDLYRSEKGIKPWSEINRQDIGAWIENKEARWPELEHTGFRDLLIDNKSYEPFNAAGINDAIRKQGLVYGAGYGMYMKPTFFLAQLRSFRTISGLTVSTSGTEYVRDLFTSPGMLQGKNIFLRLEPLMVLLLYKFSELNTRRVTALEDAFAHYGFHHKQIIDQTFEKRLWELTDRYADVLLNHEIAEFHENIPEWKDLLTLAGDRKAEHYLRAVKDLIADTSDYGPYKRIIDLQDRGALGLTIALMEGYRKVIYPEMQEAYREFARSNDWSVIEEARKNGYRELRLRRDRIVDLYHEKGGKESFHKQLKDLVQHI